MIKVGDNALAEFLDELLVWEAVIVAIILTNRKTKSISALQQE